MESKMQFVAEELKREKFKSNNQFLEKNSFFQISQMISLFSIDAKTIDEI